VQRDLDLLAQALLFEEGVDLAIRERQRALLDFRVDRHGLGRCALFQGFQFPPSSAVCSLEVSMTGEKGEA